jgi:hypothetical protein
MKALNILIDPDEDEAFTNLFYYNTLRIWINAADSLDGSMNDSLNDDSPLYPYSKDTYATGKVSSTKVTLILMENKTAEKNNANWYKGNDKGSNDHTKLPGDLGSTKDYDPENLPGSSSSSSDSDTDSDSSGTDDDSGDYSDDSYSSDDSDSSSGYMGDTQFYEPDSAMSNPQTILSEAFNNCDQQFSTDDETFRYQLSDDEDEIWLSGTEGEGQQLNVSIAISCIARELGTDYGTIVSSKKVEHGYSITEGDRYVISFKQLNLEGGDTTTEYTCFISLKP